MSLSRLIMIALLLLLATTAAAQGPAETLAELPASYQLRNVRYEPQGWNNCGPATVTNALTFFGYTDNQLRAANWLKPNGEDKNVSPWQMAEFVNEQVPELPVLALVRSGGTLDLMKALLAHDFPVIIEKGYDPEPDRLGWMGHYLLLIGYDDGSRQFITHDSYIGANVRYTYDYIEEYWWHFNNIYLVLYNPDREDVLMALLGDDADERRNHINALEMARAAAIEDRSNAFSWFNMGTNFAALEMYAEAAVAFDQARNLGLPYRMMWYQFGPFEAYYHVGRYDDMLVLAQSNLNDGGGQYVEETYYYGGLARMAKGEHQRALTNLNTAIEFNPNFRPAVEARDELLALMADG